MLNIFTVIKFQIITPNTDAETEVSTPDTNNVNNSTDELKQNNSNSNYKTQGGEISTGTTVKSPTEGTGTTPKP
ncbi:hypothetical protein [Clostridium sp. UBA1056]|uniref:hypothetical protein n=1 Tax=unclassified Clostridium TaxID=2614128 RepID=UPI003217CCA8